MTPVGRCVRLEPWHDVTIRLNDGSHFRIRDSDGRRLAAGRERSTELYRLTDNTQIGKLEMVRTDFYRIVSGNTVAYSHANRLNLLFRGLYEFAPVFNWCKEAGL